MSFCIVLYDRSNLRNQLLPLVATRPVANLRVGAYTLDHKWSLLLESQVCYLTVDYLQNKFLLNPFASDVLLLNSHVLPSMELVLVLKTLKKGEKLVDKQGNWIAIMLHSSDIEEWDDIVSFQKYHTILFEGTLSFIYQLEDVFIHNANQITFDYERFFKPDNPNAEIGLYISPSAQIGKSVILDTSKGPIIIEDHATVEPGCVVYGPCVLSKQSRVKAGTVIYPNVTIGPSSTVGGELNNVVIWGNSAKGHYGYLGCAVVGEGCNLGAGTSNSNLQNDWSDVKLYSYVLQDYRDTGLRKCGAFIGDHSMLGINSKITTGCIIGVGVQVAISNFIPKFVPDFTWSSERHQTSYNWDKFWDMMQRKSTMKEEVLPIEDMHILSTVYENTKHLRNY